MNDDARRVSPLNDWLASLHEPDVDKIIEKVKESIRRRIEQQKLKSDLEYRHGAAASLLIRALVASDPEAYIRYVEETDRLVIDGKFDLDRLLDDFTDIK